MSRGSRLAVRVVLTLAAVVLLALGTQLVAQGQQFAGRTLTFLAIQPHAGAGDLLKQGFEADTGATVNVVVVPFPEVRQRLTLDVTSGQRTIDALEFHYIDLGALATDGLIEDLTDFIAANRNTVLPGDFIGKIYDVYTLYNSRRWGLPYDGDVHALFYNKTIFNQLGLEPPVTWDDYLRIERTITEANLTNADGQRIYGAAIMAFPFPVIIISTFANRLGGFGGDFLDANGRPVINSPEAVAALQALIDEAPYAFPTPLEVSFDQSVNAFLSGQAAIAEGWTDLGIIAQDFDGSRGSKIRDQWGVVAMPVGPGREGQNRPSLNAGWTAAVSTGSRDPELARAFVLYATSVQTAIRLNTFTSGLDPTRFSTLNSADYRNFAPEVAEAVAENLPDAFPWPNVPQTPELLQALIDNIQLALQGQLTAQQALDATQEAWLGILGQ